MKPLEILETCLYVDDLTVAEQFYSQVLGLDFVGRKEGRHVFFRCGISMLLLFDAQACSGEPSDLPTHGTTGAGHVAFAVLPDDLSGWRARLEAAHVTIEREVDWPDGGQSLYFRDPAGNSLELATRELWGLAAAQLD